MQSNIECKHVFTDHPNTFLFIAGDLNSRCKDFLDYIPDDNLFHILVLFVDYDGSYFNAPRCSKDSIRGNNFG